MHIDGRPIGAPAPRRDRIRLWRENAAHRPLGTAGGRRAPTATRAAPPSPLAHISPPHARTRRTSDRFDALTPTDGLAVRRDPVVPCHLFFYFAAKPAPLFMMKRRIN
ncbi:hypothetical protein EVAR_74413_1 [Eumeta japonica]|uniref:Uncharacterized protein n=1 Tax=Eumeta variegata TaxID=151549 RepID=A0A4C1SFH0_EUMVA|nr:hypothetical protein EVAR_74413_1 [Eumeta japonica]